MWLFLMVSILLSLILYWIVLLSNNIDHLSCRMPKPYSYGSELQNNSSSYFSCLLWNWWFRVQSSWDYIVKMGHLIPVIPCISWNAEYFFRVSSDFIEINNSSTASMFLLNTRQLINMAYTKWNFIFRVKSTTKEIGLLSEYK